MRKIPTGDMRIVLGDFNAKIGNNNEGLQTIMSCNGLGSVRNGNGEHLVEFCTTHNMFIGGSRFPHKDIHKYTWQSPGGRMQNQIDHVLISRRFHNTLLDVRSLRGADVHSDHNLVVARVRLRPTALNNRCIGRRKLNLAKLKNPESCKEYRRYFNTNLENIGAEYARNDVATACTSAAKSSLGFVKQQNKPWLRESTWQIVQKRRNIQNQLQSTHDPIRKVNLASRYKIADTEVKDKAAKDKERYYNEIASAAEKAAYKNDLKGVYVAINKLANVKPHMPPLKDIEGNTLTTVEKQLTEWRRHYETRESVEEADAVPCNRRRNPNRNISTEPPSSSEIKTTIHKLKNNKAAGLDGIPPELLKFGADEITPLLRPLLLQIWSTTIIPIDWKEGIIILEDNDIAKMALDCLR
ncbi:uncharacterized protein LOC128860880 [Anastrepha ludens]|uniref:uncharacterized protein LOC128860880 n=1 Tax=Anastrepha ludens TaxID=28586 RepID=UPI0023B0A478|nr:uncharacterized protein LOC128860880 [Anastrepha ludens]